MSEKIDMIKNKKMDLGMLVTIIILLCFGIVMVSSASSYYSLSTYGDSNYLLTRQLGLAVAGFVGMLVISKINYKSYKKVSYIGYIFALFLLILVLVPGVGQTRNGATRWLSIAGNTFQPSEIMKIVLVLATATYLSLNYKKEKGLKGYVFPLILLGLVILIMFLQKHMSGTVVMVVASASVIFACGKKIKVKYILFAGVIVSLAVTAFVILEPFRVKRVLAFINPEEDIKGDNWQAAQSIYAIGSGGIFGRGLGQSRQKYLWLPEAQNDFIFSVLGEEFGLVGTITVLGVFTFFIYRGFRIAATCKDLFGSLIATGITSVFALQIIVNIAVVTCTMPVTRNAITIF